jgi:hypothetical protein
METVDWMHQAQDRDQWGILVKRVISNFGFIQSKIVNNA